MNRFKALIFDWDGTLMDSPGRITHCFQLAAREVGLGELPASRIRPYIGLGLWEAVTRMVPEADHDTLRALIERYRHHDGGDHIPRPSLFEGVQAMLVALEAEGYLLGVATSKSRQGLDRVLAATGLAGRFHVSRTADEARSKPHPEMLLDVLDRLGVAPDEALMIGDSSYDLEMAANAGVPSVGVRCGVHDEARLSACRPLAILDRSTDLPRWLESERD